MLGKTLGHYEILGKLGAGGMGDVYRARDTKLDRELAIKVLPAHLAQDPDRRSRFTREAQAVAKLKHPNIITIHSVEEIDGVHFLTMEFVEGDTLAAMIPRDGLDTDRFFSYTIALADAVSAAHDEGITHRDLKPANIMFDKGGRLKVLDFGLAKMMEEKTPPRRTTPPSCRAAPRWRVRSWAPRPTCRPNRPRASRSTTARTSSRSGCSFTKWPAGGVLSRAIRTSRPSPRCCGTRPPPITEIRQNLPRHLGRIINRCLEKDPDRRYQTAKDVRNELEDLKKEMDSGITMSGRPRRPRSSRRRLCEPRPSRPWLPWAIGAMAVVAVAVAVWSFLQPERPIPRESGHTHDLAQRARDRQPRRPTNAR